MSKFNDLVAKLREIFQIDRPDLDFGIYRIINARADEINEYLEKRLKEKVEAALASGSAANIDQLQSELTEAEKKAQALSIPADDIPKVRELKAKIKEAMSGSAEHENAVFSHLLTFFSRYYDNGDFISQRRYKGDTYAIPYAGEEVMLHWANKDQYYIKSGENFSNYSFKLDDGRTVHFRLIAADTAKDNRKDNDKERRFVLAEHKTVISMDEEGEAYDDEILPVEMITVKDSQGNDSEELVIHFEYKAMPKGSKQDKLVDEAVKAILANDDVKTRWMDLTRRTPTEKNPKRTYLEKQLTNYTAKNKADYFIHKNLNEFLQQELNFYIKNEVMHLDDIQNTESVRDIEKNLRAIQCIRRIAIDLITFLSQLETFQKKLWCKRKFVTESNYCISIGKLDKDLFDIIIECDQQWEEWYKYGLTDQKNYTNEQKKKVMNSNKNLPIDTANFTDIDKGKILSSISNIDEFFSGLAINGENYNALKLIENKFTDKIKLTYIDPPFNLGETPDYLYKVDYKDSSWLSLLSNRLEVNQPLISEDGGIFVRCNHDGNMLVRLMMENVFGKENYRNEIIVRRAEESKGDLNKQFKGVKSITVNYDNIYWFSKVSHHRFNRFMKPASDKQSKSHWHSFWKAEDRPNMRYELLGVDLTKHYGQWMWKRERAEKAVQNYVEYLKIYEETGESLDDYWKRTGEQLEFIKCDGNKISSVKYWIRPRTEIMADNNWLDIKGYANKWKFKTENSEGLLKRVISSQSLENEIILDYFAGSGTTAATAEKLNRKWITVEMGDHFDSIVKQRLINVLNGESSGISKEVEYSGGGAFKYIKIESYDDTLNNIILKKNKSVDDLFLDSEPSLRDDYLIRYMMSIESKGSLLNVDDFRRPFVYHMNVAIDSAGASVKKRIDLVETFNYLIGLTVNHIDAQPERGFTTVTGTLPSGEKTLVLWRDCERIDYEGLNKLCDRLAINPSDNEFDVVYINGDHNIPTVLAQTAEEGGETKTLKLRQIEPEFLERMFAVEDE